ncbi:MAG: hypothetical protein U9Q03_02215 [Patescibacteria group bacterium]|nr:hypothetical protein [Patescibacteria group bacterium]
MTEENGPRLSQEEHERLLGEAMGGVEAMHFFGQFHHQCGRVVGEDQVIKVIEARGPSKVSEETLELFGVTADEKCILVTWVPAATVYEKGDEVVKTSVNWKITKPRVAGTDPSQIPPENELHDFPDEYMGLPVMYAGGEYPYYDVEFPEDNEDE